MNNNKKIKGEQDLINLAKILKETGYDLTGIWIKIPFRSYNLKRLDKYLFEKFNPGIPYTNEKVVNDEIYVTIEGITFHLCGDGNYERAIKKDEVDQEYFDD
jgi:hypothetical protein